MARQTKEYGTARYISYTIILVSSNTLIAPSRDFAADASLGFSHRRTGEVVTPVIWEVSSR